MVYYYDQAIINSLEDITRVDGNNKKIHIIPPDEIMNLEGSLNNDKIKLPLISLTRPSWSLQDKRPHTMRFTGFKLDFDEESQIYTNVQAMPIRINYQMDIWTTSRLENDMIFRELLWYYSLNPTLDIVVPYNEVNFKHTFNIFFDNEVEDNSDIVDHKNTGRLFRQTISFYTDDAYLWKVQKSRTKFSLDVYLEAEGKEELIYDTDFE